MTLLINTQNSEKIIVQIDGTRLIADAKVEKAQKLLSVIREVLSKKGAEIHDIKEIEVNTGPGSFTGLRVGISVANALGWALGIPVNGKDVTKKPSEPVYE